jgi:hypothetical protein
MCPNVITGSACSTQTEAAIKKVSRRKQRLIHSSPSFEKPSPSGGNQDATAENPDKLRGLPNKHCGVLPMFHIRRNIPGQIPTGSLQLNTSVITIQMFGTFCSSAPKEWNWRTAVPINF